MSSPEHHRHVRSTPTPMPPASSLPNAVQGDADDFSHRYNRVSFLFEHDLHDHPLFSWSSLLELADRHPQSPMYAYWSNGSVGVRDSWDSAGGPRYSVRDTVFNIATNDSLAMLKHVEEDAALGPCIREIQEEVLDLAGTQMSADAICARGTLLIASPRRITSYHIDSDVNFLFQIAGEKLFRVFDQSCPAVTSHEELENYFLGDPSGAIFKPERQADARCYELRAGSGVHVPCMAAHWAQNLDSPSVALSINFDLRSIASVGRLYRLNGRLRRLGLNPTPPGRSKWRDISKQAALELARFRPKPAKSGHADTLD